MWYWKRDKTTPGAVSWGSARDLRVGQAGDKGEREVYVMPNECKIKERGRIGEAGDTQVG